MYSIHLIVSFSRVFQDFLVEMDRQDLRYTCNMIKPSLMLLYLDSFFRLNTLMYFQGFRGEKGLPGLIGRSGPKVSFALNINGIHITIWRKAESLHQLQTEAKL